MPRFSPQFDNEQIEAGGSIPKKTFEDNSLVETETMYDGPRFKNPSEIELLGEEENKGGGEGVLKSSLDSLAEHTRAENNEISDGSIKELKNYLQMKLPSSPYKDRLVFDVPYIRDKEKAERFINDLSPDFVTNEQKREIMSILGLTLEEGVKIPISKVEEEKLDFKKGDKVIWTVSGRVYTVKMMAGDYVIVEELTSPLSLSMVKKVESTPKPEPDNSFAKAVEDREKEFNEKDVGPKEKSNSLTDTGVYKMVDLDKEEFIQRESSFDILNKQVESKEKSLSEVKNYLFDYIEKSLPKSEDVIPLHKGIDFARSFNEIRAEINDAFNLKIIDADQKDLMYHLAGLKENEELNKFSQFEVPVLPEDETKESKRNFYSLADTGVNQGFNDEETKESRRPFIVDEETKESTREFNPLPDRATFPAVDVSKEEKPEKIDMGKVGQFEILKEDNLPNDLLKGNINDKGDSKDEMPARNPDEVISSKSTKEKPAEKEPQVLDIKADMVMESPPVPENAKGIEVEDFEELFKKAEQIDINLEKAREDYASAKIEFLNKHRQKKNVFAKAMFDLGVEKQMPKSDEIPEELKGLEKVYIEANKEKSRYLFAKGLKKEEAVSTGFITVETREYSFNEDLVKALEQEMDKFNRAMESGRPPLERGILSKTLEKWSKLSPTSRVLLSSVLMTGATVAFGAIPLAGAVAYGGYRAARGLEGMVTSQAVGKGIQNRFDKNNTLSKKKFEEGYGRDITEENFADKQKEAMDFYESEKDKKKRQLLKKATAMAATGAGVAIGSGAILHHLDGVLNAKVPLPETHPIKPSVPEGALKSSFIETELSSKGFIKTFDEMKGKILEKYGNVAKVPENIKHFVETPSTKLAEEFGMYNPEHNLSGVGLKGESLTLDSKGNLSYEHLSGNKDVLYDSSTGNKTEFAGKMMDKDGHFISPKEVLNTTENNIPEASASPIEKVLDTTHKPKIIEIAGKPFSPLDNLVVDNHTVALADLEGKKVLVYDNQAIAQEVLDPKPGAYPLALADKLQDGKAYTEVRKAFRVAMDKMVEGYKNIGYRSAKLPFEGGIIQVVTDASNEVGKTELYLNGKHFASGIINEKGSQVLLDEGVRGSWWSSDNVYERALKASKTNIFENISHLLKN